MTTDTSRRALRRAVSPVLIGEGIVLLTGLAVLLHLTPGPHLTAPLTLVLVVVCLTALTLLPPVHVELRRHSTSITAGDAVLVVGLVLLSPLAFVAAVTLTELLVGFRQPQAPIKRLYNLLTMATSALLGALAFTVLGTDAPLDPRTWVAASVGLLVITLADALAMAAVLARTEGERYLPVLWQVLLPMLVGSLLSLPLGLLALLAIEVAPLLLALLLPIAALLSLSARAVTQQRTERQHVQRLYDAAAELPEVTELLPLLTQVGGSARQLVTGAGALVRLAHTDGPEHLLLHTDAGTRWLADPAITAALTRLTSAPRTATGPAAVTTSPPADPGTAPDAGVLVSRELPDPLGELLAGSTCVLWATRRTGRGSALTVVVAREPAPDGQEAQRLGLLTAFLHQATLAVRNAELQADLATSLATEQRLHARKRDFIAAVSHELLTPLTGMRGALETLSARNTQLTSDQRTLLLDLAQRHTGRLGRLIDDLLLVASAEQGQLHPTRTLLRTDDHATELARRGAALTDRLVVHPPDDPRLLHTDPELLDRLLDELITNAVKYAPQGPIDLTYPACETGQEIRVRDHGPGIPAGFREQLFTPFAQRDATSTRGQGGTGLGLHLAARLAGVLGGRLRIEDPPDGGACLVLWLPVHEDEAVLARRNRPA